MEKCILTLLVECTECGDIVSEYAAREVTKKRTTRKRAPGRGRKFITLTKEIDEWVCIDCEMGGKNQ
jgi:hypothetical protein